MSRLAILLGAGNAALAIVFGAFASHGLRSSLSENMLSIFQTAVDYHIYHALVMMLIGIVAFCGSLYGLSMSGKTWLGMITPVGGLSFIAAWVLIVIAYLNDPGK